MTRITGILFLLLMLGAVNAEGIPKNLLPIGFLEANLAGGDEKKFFVARITAVMEFYKVDTVKEAKKRLAQLQNEIIMFISSKTVKDVKTDRKYKRLRKELVDHLSSLFATGKVKNIYFTMFLIKDMAINSLQP